MADASAEARLQETEAWWRTGLTDIGAEYIRVRGYAIEDLIGNVGLAQMIWLLIRGELPDRRRAALLEAAMLGGVVHGPHAPSIAVARMAMTCGVGINQAIAQGAAVLGDVHGGAIQQTMELLERLANCDGSDASIAAVLDVWAEENGAFIPGFGHRFHRNGDPRTPRLQALAENARQQGLIDGRHMANAQAVERVLSARKRKLMPMNLDGVAGAIFLELGFPPPIGRGFVVLARSIGVLANAWEEMRDGGRLKGPVPPSVGFVYDGPAPRRLPSSAGD